MAVRNAQAEKCDLEGASGSDSATHHIEWRVVRAASNADAARAAQAFNRPVALVRTGAAQCPSTATPW